MENSVSLVLLLFFWNLEFILSEKLVLALLHGQEVRGDLLQMILLLLLKVVNLADDFDLSESGSNPEGSSLRAVELRFEPHNFLIRHLTFKFEFHAFKVALEIVPYASVSFLSSRNFTINLSDLCVVSRQYLMHLVSGVRSTRNYYVVVLGG